MDEDTIKQALRSLNQVNPASRANNQQDQVRILYWCCQYQSRGYSTERKFFEDVGRKVDYGWQTTQQGLDHIISKLGGAGVQIKGRMDIPSEVCQALNEMIPVVEGRHQFWPWPPPVSETSNDPPPEQLRTGTEPLTVRGWRDLDPKELPSGHKETSQSTDDPRNPWIFRILAIGIGLVLLWALLDRFTPFTVTEQVVVTRAVEVTRPVEIFQTAPPDPEEVALAILQTQEALPTQTAVLQIEEVPIEVTRIEEVTRIIPEIQTVVVTPVPPTATSIPQTVTISENFDDFEVDAVLNPSGDYTISNGLLSGPFSFEIGDDTWRNYQINFQVSGTVQYDWRLRVRENDSAFLEYHEHGAGGGWNYSRGGPLTPIDNTDPRWALDVEIIVVDNRIIHQAAGRIEFANLYSENGRITFTMNANSTFDNLVITRND